jgi:hypothetical protein
MKRATPGGGRPFCVSRPCRAAPGQALYRAGPTGRVAAWGPEVERIIGRAEAKVVAIAS